MASQYEALAPTPILEQQNETFGLMDRVGGYLHDALGSIKEGIDSMAQSRFVRIGLAVGAVAAGSTEIANAKAASPVQSKANNLYTSASMESSAHAAQNSDRNVFGRNQVTSIQGFSVDFRQSVAAVESTPASIKTTYNCPSSTGGRATPAVAAVETFAGNKANVTFCPTGKMIKVSKPIASDPMLPGALSKFQSDPMRNNEFAGNNYDRNLFYLCPESPKQQDPQPKVSYNKRNKTATVAYDGGATYQYCDEVGQFSETLIPQVQSSSRGKWKTAGRNVIRIDGMRETLLYGQYGVSERNARDKVSVKINNPCSTSKNAQVRFKIVERFVGNPSQTFVNDSNGNTTGMRSGKAAYYSVPKKACR